MNVLIATYKIDYGYDVERINNRVIGIFDNDNDLQECLSYYMNSVHYKDFIYDIRVFEINQYLK